MERYRKMELEGGVKRIPQINSITEDFELLRYQLLAYLYKVGLTHEATRFLCDHIIETTTQVRFNEIKTFLKTQ